MGTREKLAIRKWYSTMRKVEPGRGALNSCGVSTLRGMQNLTGSGPEQLYLLGAGGRIRRPLEGPSNLHVSMLQ